MVEMILLQEIQPKVMNSSDFLEPTHYCCTSVKASSVAFSSRLDSLLVTFTAAGALSHFWRRLKLFLSMVLSRGWMIDT
jgi:hypothetical protein